MEMRRDDARIEVLENTMRLLMDSRIGGDNAEFVQDILEAHGRVQIDNDGLVHDNRGLRERLIELERQSGIHDGGSDVGDGDGGWNFAESQEKYEEKCQRVEMDYQETTRSLEREIQELCDAQRYEDQAADLKHDLEIERVKNIALKMANDKLVEEANVLNLQLVTLESCGMADPSDRQEYVHRGRLTRHVKDLEDTLGEGIQEIWKMVEAISDRLQDVPDKLRQTQKVSAKEEGNSEEGPMAGECKKICEEPEAQCRTVLRELVRWMEDMQDVLWR
ncbi:hypothetical protein P154DRAFT_14338 [Amniculicola lignicola CBS 123094]|uniref:Uncharacterized protein n=1 Tax=Amniculicola lignicola CBS 123094 TaxID=1392246 RepID=A0A6A5X5E8_9PLEO|nr:hypothetical protein P154DRAFT_14338 [Amniculicola lignicola CBS 123094]